MEDIRDIHQAMKDTGRERRASHRENSPALLEEAGIVFISKNNGAHLVVEGRDSYIDFWPGTGRWKDRRGSAPSFGVRNLIKFINA